MSMQCHGSNIAIAGKGRSICAWLILFIGLFSLSAGVVAGQYCKTLTPFTFDMLPDPQKGPYLEIKENSPVILPQQLVGISPLVRFKHPETGNTVTATRGFSAYKEGGLYLLRQNNDRIVKCYFKFNPEIISYNTALSLPTNTFVGRSEPQYINKETGDQYYHHYDGGLGKTLVSSQKTHRKQTFWKYEYQSTELLVKATPEAVSEQKRSHSALWKGIAVLQEMLLSPFIILYLAYVAVIFLVPQLQRLSYIIGFYTVIGAMAFGVVLLAMMLFDGYAPSTGGETVGGFVLAFISLILFIIVGIVMIIPIAIVAAIIFMFKAIWPYLFLIGLPCFLVVVRDFVGILLIEGLAFFTRHRVERPLNRTKHEPTFNASLADEIYGAMETPFRGVFSWWDGIRLEVQARQLRRAQAVMDEEANFHRKYQDLEKERERRRFHEDRYRQRYEE